MPVVGVMHQFAQSELGHVAHLRDVGIELVERRVAEGEPLHDLGEVDGIVVLGGDQTATLADADPVLVPQVAHLRAAVAAGTPVLGICLGAQLLAHALGARVRHAGRAVEWRALSRTAAGVGDPLFAALEDPVPALHWNEDVFDLPAGAEALVTPGGEGVAAFRAGGGALAWGVQYHPDVDPVVLANWLREWPDQIPDEDRLRADSERVLPAQARASAELFDGFARVVAARA